MAQIRIHTEQVRDAGRQFRAKSEQLSDIDSALQSAIGNLDTWAWDGRSRADAEPMLDQVRPESARIAQELDRLGQLLERVAERFENEDNDAARKIEGMNWIEFEDVTSDIPDTSSTINKIGESQDEDESLWKKISNGLEKFSTGFEHWGETGKMFKVLVAPTVSGLSGNWLKDALSLGGKNFTRGFGEDVIGIGGIGPLAEILSEIDENWKEYDRDVPKAAIGIVFDTWLGVGLPILGSTIGTTAGAAIGTAIGGPVGTVIGGKVGAIIGGWLGGECTEWVENWKIDGKELDQTVVEAVSGVTEKVGEAIGEGVYNAVEGIVSFFD